MAAASALVTEKCLEHGIAMPAAASGLSVTTCSGSARPHAASATPAGEMWWRQEDAAREMYRPRSVPPGLDRQSFGERPVRAPPQTAVTLAGVLLLHRSGRSLLVDHLQPNSSPQDPRDPDLPEAVGSRAPGVGPIARALPGGANPAPAARLTDAGLGA